MADQPVWNPDPGHESLHVRRWPQPPAEKHHHSSRLLPYIQLCRRALSILQEKNKNSDNPCFQESSIRIARITDNVRSIYGRLLRLLTSIETSFASEAAYAIRSPVRNCELSEPSVWILEGTNGPLSRSGSLPKLELYLPRVSEKFCQKNPSACSSRLPSPSMVIVCDTHGNQGCKHPDTQSAFTAIHKITYRPYSPAFDKQGTVREIFNNCTECADYTNGSEVVVGGSGIDYMCFCLRDQCGCTSPLHGTF